MYIPWLITFWMYIRAMGMNDWVLRTQPIMGKLVRTQSFKLPKIWPLPLGMVEFQWELQPHDGTDGDYDGIQIRQKADAFTESNEGLTAPGGRTLHAIYIPCTMYAYSIIAPFRKFYGIWSHSQTKVESKILKAILDETT